MVLTTLCNVFVMFIFFGKCELRQLPQPKGEYRNENGIAFWTQERTLTTQGNSMEEKKLNFKNRKGNGQIRTYKFI